MLSDWPDVLSEIYSAPAFSNPGRFHFARSGRAPLKVHTAITAAADSVCDTEAGGAFLAANAYPLLPTQKRR